MKGWSSEPAQIYSINSIPYNYLLDANGIIIAKNLRGANLDTELDNILNGITGVNENYYPSENPFTIYPNPANEILYLKGNNKLSASFLLYDITGRKIMEHAINSGYAEISLSGLSGGLYLYRINTKDGISVNGKLIIAK